MMRAMATTTTTKGNAMKPIKMGTLNLAALTRDARTISTQIRLSTEDADRENGLLGRAAKKAAIRRLVDWVRSEREIACWRAHLIADEYDGSGTTQHTEGPIEIHAAEVEAACQKAGAR